MPNPIIIFPNMEIGKLVKEMLAPHVHISIRQEKNVNM
jgi:hypothetical protein